MRKTRIMHLLIGALVLTGCGAAEKVEWIAVSGSNDFGEWRGPTGDWVVAGEVFSDPDNEKRLSWKLGHGILVNGKEGRTKHLVSRDEFGDMTAHVEFMVSKGSNSGVYFQGRYEIQILDSWGKAKPKYSDCGGIYQRWRTDKGLKNSERGYEGKAPNVNASRPPGEWQTFDVVFRAPRFDTEGNKVANAKFLKVCHNGKLVHENEEVKGPTRASPYKDEQPRGPLLLQGDHGPVAYRNVRIRPIVIMGN
ncbi:DUF1080 domain-containing protein [Candidatus Hydrogenedentota bacterium]